MAKIKITGYSDFIQINDNEAKQISKLWHDDSITKDKKIKIGNISVIKADIRGIFISKEDQRNISQEKYRQRFIGYYEQRDELLTLNPKERAEKIAFNHFSLFYWAFNKKIPDKSLREEIIQKAENFFKNNTQWSKPSIKCWYELYPDYKTRTANGAAIGVLFRVEEQELIDIEAKEDYTKSKFKQEDELEKIERLAMSDDINAEDIPF